MLRTHEITIFGITYDLDDLPIPPMLLLPFLGVTILGVLAIAIACLTCGRSDVAIKKMKIVGNKKAQNLDIPS